MSIAETVGGLLTSLDGQLDAVMVEGRISSRSGVVQSFKSSTCVFRALALDYSMMLITQIGAFRAAYGGS
jgi:hypothetical protein